MWKKREQRRRVQGPKSRSIFTISKKKSSRQIDILLKSASYPSKYDTNRRKIDYDLVQMSNHSIDSLLASYIIQRRICRQRREQMIEISSNMFRTVEIEFGKCICIDQRNGIICWLNIDEKGEFFTKIVDRND